MAKKTKAWKVEDASDGEGHCAIVFADTRNQARRQGLGYLDACEYLEMRATRAPEFDGRQKNPPTLRELVQKHGWWVECSWCNTHVTEDSRKAVWSPKGHDAYCSKRCRQKRLAYSKKLRKQQPAFVPA